MRRFIDRHWTLIAFVASLLVVVYLECKFQAGQLVSRMAVDGTLISLFATLAGFLTTGITILLALADHSALKFVSGTRAFSYVHYTLVGAIWAQVFALLMSVIVKVSPLVSGSVPLWSGRLLLAASLIALSMLLVSVLFMTLVVNRVVRHWRKEARDSRAVDA